MELQNLSLNHKNGDKYYEIICIKTRKTKNYSDIYIFDKSYTYFHISYHKDGNVFITPENSNFKPYKIYNNLKLDYKLVSSFLHYFPINIEKYPIHKIKKKYTNLYRFI